MELGIISLSDLTADPHTGRPVAALARLDAPLAYARAADQLGLDVFALGEHHSHKFAVASPAVALAAIAGQTERIRLTSGVTVLSALDPVRVYQDFAQLDLVSHGRAEIMPAAAPSRSRSRSSARPGTNTTSCSPKSSTCCCAYASRTGSPGAGATGHRSSTPRSPRAPSRNRYQCGSASAAPP